MGRYAVLLVVAGLAAAGCWDRKTAGGGAARTADPGPVTPLDTPAGEVVEVKTSSDVHRDFQQNVIAANKKWAGKRVRMHTLVMRIGQDGKDYYIETDGVSELVWIDPRYADEFGTVPPRTQCLIEATFERCDQGVRGAIEGMQLVFRNARLVKKEKTYPEP